MSKTERTIVVVGAGIIVLAWLFGRCKCAGFLSGIFSPGPDEARGTPPKSVNAIPINNAFSTCNCPAARTTQRQPGDYSQGNFVRIGAVAIPPTISG